MGFTERDCRARPNEHCPNACQARRQQEAPPDWKGYRSLTRAQKREAALSPGVAPTKRRRPSRRAFFYGCRDVNRCAPSQNVLHKNRTPTGVSCRPQQNIRLGRLGTGRNNVPLETECGQARFGTCAAAPVPGDFFFRGCREGQWVSHTPTAGDGASTRVSTAKKATGRRWCANKTAKPSLHPKVVPSLVRRRARARNATVAPPPPQAP